MQCTSVTVVRFYPKLNVSINFSVTPAKLLGFLGYEQDKPFTYVITPDYATKHVPTC